MSHLKYYAYPGHGDMARKSAHHNQAVRVGDLIHISGQGGWDPETSEMKTDLHEEIDQTVQNVDHALKHAGGKGWAQVYRVNSYHTDMSEDAVMYFVEALKKAMPDHQPIWTAVGVTKLGLSGMRIEIEVSAHDEEGAAAARK